MMPQRSDGPGDSRRTFPPHIVHNLTQALRAFQADGEGSIKPLETAVHEAAAYARSRSMQPEELVIAMKAVLGSLHDNATPPSVREKTRSVLLQRLLNAYFAEPRG